MKSLLKQQISSLLQAGIVSQTCIAKEVKKQNRVRQQIIGLSNNTITIDNCLSEFNDNFKDNHNALFILTGKVSNIIVIELYNQNSYDLWNKLIEENNYNDINTVSCKSSHSITHYYFKYDERFSHLPDSKNITIDDKKIPIKVYCGKKIFGAPTKYANSKGNDVLYEWSNSIDNNDIQQVPKWLHDLIIENIQDSVKVDMTLNDITPAEQKEEQHKLYSIDRYLNWTAKRINKEYTEYSTRKLEKLLIENDRGYHMRIHKSTNYILYIDVDGYRKDINIFFNVLITFFKEYYNIIIEIGDIKYTQNIGDGTSYHLSIPKYYCTSDKQHEIFNKLKLACKCDDYKYEHNGKNKKVIDISIYCEKWFRYPNQSKEGKINTKHKIINGCMRDFIVEYIPEASICIENNIYINKTVTQKTGTKNKQQKKHKNNEENNIDNSYNIDDDFEKELMKSNNYKYYSLYRKLFDNCYKSSSIATYDVWIEVGMSLKNIYGDDAFPLFNYFSSKAKNYDGYEETLKKYNSFNNNGEGYKVGTIYYHAKNDNLEVFKKIMKHDDLLLKHDDFAKTIKELAGDKYFYKKIGEDNYKLYGYTGSFWESGSVALKKFIGEELRTYYKQLLIDVYWNENRDTFSYYKNCIDNLGNDGPKRSIIESYKQYGINNDIEFDSKWYLLGFNNLVYDLRDQTFRDYRMDDYVTMTTGYNWREPTKEELFTMNEIIRSIMPIDDEREFYLQVLSTSLQGLCVEKFIIFNGGGGNGKGMINDLLLIALGDYGIIGTNSILFEKGKTGSNPEKANLEKKRLVIFREPPEKDRFQNSVVKELTGGGKFSARTHHEKETEKILHNTTICECNKKPLFAEEPTDADIRRIYDIPFRSSYTEDKDLIDHENYIFEANKDFKNLDFQQKHKYALIKILMEANKRYLDNNSTFVVPDFIKKRTEEYLQDSCDILQWIKDYYEVSDNKDDFVKLKDMFDKFKESDFWFNLTKRERRKYNYKFFIEYCRTNIYLRKFYRENLNYTNKDGRKTTASTVLIKWKCLELKN